MLSRYKTPTHPGEVLSEEFLKPLGVSRNAFASHLGWPPAKVNEIIHGRRGITPEAALSLADVLKTTPDLWLNLQRNYDLSKAMKTHHKKKTILVKTA
jgi:addiction module HigA family antidote